MKREIRWRVFYQDDAVKVDFDMNTINVDAIATVLRGVDLETFKNQPATDNLLLKVYAAITEEVDKLQRNGTLFWNGIGAPPKWEARREAARKLHLDMLQTASDLSPRDIAWMNNAPTKALIDHARAVEAFLVSEGKLTRNDEGGFS
jgi:hypothetical protein